MPNIKEITLKNCVLTGGHIGGTDSVKMTIDGGTYTSGIVTNINMDYDLNQLFGSIVSVDYSVDSTGVLVGGVNTVVKKGIIIDPEVQFSWNDQKFRPSFDDNYTQTIDLTSNFVIDPDSEASIVVSGDKTITTVKLSNPPVIIDWGDFPGLDLGADNHDYVISKIFASVAI